MHCYKKGFQWKETHHQLVALYNKSELALCHPYTDMLLATFKPGMILIPCHHYLATINHNRSPYPLCPAAQFVFVCVCVFMSTRVCVFHSWACMVNYAYVFI